MIRVRLRIPNPNGPPPFLPPQFAELPDAAAALNAKIILPAPPVVAGRVFQVSSVQFVIDSPGDVDAVLDGALLP